MNKKSENMSHLNEINGYNTSTIHVYKFEIGDVCKFGFRIIFKYFSNVYCRKK